MKKRETLFRIDEGLGRAARDAGIPAPRHKGAHCAHCLHSIKLSEGLTCEFDKPCSRFELKEEKNDE